MQDYVEIDLKEYDMTDLDRFLEEKNAVMNSISHLESNIERITTIDKYKGNVTEINRLAQEIRIAIKQLNNKYKSSTDKTIRLHLSALSKKFFNVLSNMDNQTKTFNHKLREEYVRRVRTVDPDFTYENIDDIDITNTDNVFSSAIMAESKHQQASDALLYVKEQHLDIMKLEKEMIELHELFIDMANLIDSQGELLDQIDTTISKTVANTSNAVTMLDVAEKKKNSSRKLCVVICLIICIMLCCLIVIIIIILAVIGIVVGVVVYLKTKK